MRITKAFFQTHDRFAVRGEAEMPRLDDAGMHWTDCNLMQAFAFDRQKQIGLRHLARRDLAERMAQAPASVIDPGPQIGRTFRFQPDKIVYSALQTSCRQTMAAEGRKSAGHGVETQYSRRAVGRIA